MKPNPRHLSEKAKQLQRDDKGRLLREAVEYSLVDHCNLRCAGCDHASPHFVKRFADPKSFTADMAALAQHLHVRILRLLGGEPLLHPEVGAFVRAAQRVGIADQVALWTNGLLLHTVSRELLESFDVVRVSLYPGIHLRADLPQLARELAKNGRTRLEVVPVQKFMHQLVNDPIEDSRQVRRTYLRCKETHVWSCHTVHEGWYYKCTKPSVLSQRLANCGVEVANRTRDGVALHGNQNLAEDLEHYLVSTEPLMACTWCLGTDGKSFDHHQLDDANLKVERLNRRNWTTLKTHPLKRLLRDIRDSF